MSYASLEDLKDYRDISVTTHDALLQNLLERISTKIDTHCSRWFEARTETRYFEDTARRGHTLILVADLISIDTLTNGDDDGTEIPDTEYWLIDRNSGPPYYGIRLKSASTYAWEFDQDCWVSVAGSWGWSSVPPEDVVQACVRWAAYAYDQKDTPVYETTAFPESGVITVPVGIPVDVKLMLRPYVKGF